MRSLVVLALLATLLAASTAHGASAPDAGRPFEPRPLSKPLYGTQAETHRHVVEAARRRATTGAGVARGVVRGGGS